MFAPPPVQLSRAEIQTRLAGEAQNAERVESPDKGSEDSSPNEASLHRNDSRSPISPFIKRFTGKASQRPVSPQSTERRPSLQQPKAEGNASRKTSLEGAGRLPIGFGENPRPAPAPPTRPVPVTSEVWRSPLPGAFPQPSELDSDRADGHEAAPPIPPKSARRINAANRLSARLANLEKMPTGPHRASSVGTVASRNYSHPASGQAQSTSGRKTGVRSSRVRKPSVASKVTSSTAYRGLFNPETANDAIRAPEVETSASISRLPIISQPLRTSGKVTPPAKRTDEETRTDLSPANDQKGHMSSQNSQAHEQTRRMFINKALPDTPTSVVGTPTELLERRQSPTSILRDKSHKSHIRRRSPLAQIPETDAKSNSSMSPRFGTWPGHLPVIPEHTANEEKIAVTSGASTPVATQMHLRGGSVVTVCPPESNPWQRSLYIQGPIKLPKPTIVPRKNSLASLEPFQEAIDQMYQDALYIPRRRSDDRVLAHLCDFFDEFGFEAVTFLGDSLTKDRMEADDAAELGHSELERFSTPPIELEVSPVERTVARDIIQKLSSVSTAVFGNNSGIEGAAIEPGKASQPRKDSTTLSRFDVGASRSMQTSKEATRDSRYPHALTKGNVKKTAQPPENSKLGVEELDASSEWIAPALFKRVWSKQNILREKSFHRKLAA